ncbi:hypothetical protein D039_3353A, partial [Vibrio parahaemolyticus EKP-028]
MECLLIGYAKSYQCVDPPCL